MKKVFLVDDEPLVTEVIETLVDWNKYDMCICGTANDGIAAKKAILEQKPDLVITDIRMPGLTGLELIEEVQEQLTETLFVIISGYNDFNYIRAALRLNVVDYLDKPVTVEKIQSMLKEIQRLFQKANDVSVGNTKEPVLKQQILKLLEKDSIFLQKLPEQLQGLQYVHMMAIAGEESFCKTSFFPRLKEVFLEMGIFAVLLETEDGMLVVGWSAVPYSIEEAERMLKERFSVLFAEGRISAVGISNRYDSFAEIKTAYMEAVCAREYAEFFGNEIIKNSSIEKNTSGHCRMIFQDRISFLLRTGEWKKAEETVEEIFQQLEKLSPSPDLVRHICLEIIYQSMAVCSESGKEYTEEGKDFLPHVKITSMTQAEEVKQWTQKTVCQIIEWLRKRREQTEHKDIVKAKNYIDEHYGEAITLRMLADMCYMNQNYFSAIFRDNVGITYVKYLNAVRMEHAKELLQKGQKIKVVSTKCGFQNTRYFSEKFKSYTGVTPEQYRMGGV